MSWLPVHVTYAEAGETVFCTKAMSGLPCTVCRSWRARLSRPEKAVEYAIKKSSVPGVPEMCLETNPKGSDNRTVGSLSPLL